MQKDTRHGGARQQVGISGITGASRPLGLPERLRTDSVTATRLFRSSVAVTESARVASLSGPRHRPRIDLNSKGKMTATITYHTFNTDDKMALLLYFPTRLSESWVHHARRAAGEQSRS